MKNPNYLEYHSTQDKLDFWFILFSVAEFLVQKPANWSENQTQN